MAEALVVISFPRVAWECSVGALRLTADLFDCDCDVTGRNASLMRSHVARSSFTQLCPRVVIPAGMPVSSAMDGNLEFTSA